jgi:hypothetical protein
MPGRRARTRGRPGTPTAAGPRCRPGRAGHRRLPPGSSLRLPPAAGEPDRVIPGAGPAGPALPFPGRVRHVRAGSGQVPASRSGVVACAHGARAADQQHTHLVRDRRPDRRVRIGPFPAYKTPVPGQQGARGHDPVQPEVPGQQPGQRCEHGTVSPVRPRAGDLTPRTAISCRRTKISASLTASLRARSISQPNTRTMKR